MGGGVRSPPPEPSFPPRRNREEWRLPWPDFHELRVDSPTRPKGPTVKIQVQQSDLARALTAVANVVSSKTTLPILSTILFDAKKSTLTLAATDLDV